MPKKDGFQAASREEELELLRSDTASFDRTKAYLRPLIELATKKSGVAGKRAAILRMHLLFDVEIAAKLYLENNPEERSYRFTSYYGHWLKRRVEEAG